MALAALYPGAKWKPLGAQTQRRMTAHDIVCLHTMVGYLTSTDRYFRISNGTGFRGTESHFGIGGKWGPDLGGNLDGAVWQWQDLAYSADANLDGWRNVISMETADNGGPQVRDIPPWTPKQCEGLARWLAWVCSKAAHAKCPTTWTCRKVGIPLTLIDDTKPGRRGVGYHAQGVPGNGLVAGGVEWSSSRGKECPTPQRIRQIPSIITRARQLSAPAKPATPEDDMPLTQDDVDRIAKAVWTYMIADDHTTGDSLERGRSAAMRWGDAGDLNQRLLRVDNELKTGGDTDNALVRIEGKLP